MVVKFIVKRSQNRINNWLLQGIFSWLSNRFYLLKDTVCDFSKSISSNVLFQITSAERRLDVGMTTTEEHRLGTSPTPSVASPPSGCDNRKGAALAPATAAGTGPALPGHRATRFLLQDLLQSFPCPTITGSLTTSFFCWRNWVLAKLDCDLLKVRGLILRTADERQQWPWWQGFHTTPTWTLNQQTSVSG